MGEIDLFHSRMLIEKQGESSRIIIEFAHIHINRTRMLFLSQLIHLRFEYSMSMLATFQNDPFFSGIELPRALPSESRSFREDFNRERALRHRDDVFEEPFKFMQNIIGDMSKRMKDMESRMFNMDINVPEDGHGVSFSSSTVMTYDGRNPEQPKVFQATSEKLRGPEGK